MWRLFTDHGRQIWKYLSSDSSIKGVNIDEIEYNKDNKNSGDKIYRAQCAEKYQSLSSLDLQSLIASHPLASSISDEAIPHVNLSERQVHEQLVKAIHYYQTLQMEDGHWPGDYGGPMFLLPGVIITMYVTGQTIDDHKRHEMTRYLLNHQHNDGGWGLHIEQNSTMFGTVLSYVSLRLLGLESTHPSIISARTFIHNEGGAMYTPSWGKFWLCVLGVYEWSGVNSLFPELWLLPEWIPIHPSRWWCHCRMVYMPMSYVYGKKIVGEITPLIQALRSELYVTPYHTIPFEQHRNSIAKRDLYTKPSLTCRFLFSLCNLYEPYHIASLRKRATDFLLQYIHAEDDQTKFIDIGPVNKFINMLSIWHDEGVKSEKFRAHVERVDDYLWLAEDGMKCQGYNGSQLWDTAFATQAIIESGYGPTFASCVTRAYDYVDISQVQEDVKDRELFYRHISKGGWPFSTLDHGWPITDCTAEGLKVALMGYNPLHIPTSNVISQPRCNDAINLLLSFQNTDGGWATYELTRTSSWIEIINPAEVFAGIMIDYSYVECSSASIQALCAYRKQFPYDTRMKEIDASISRGISYIRSVQRDDGSWYGAWAVCFTYGTWFGVEALVSAGYGDCDGVKHACEFLISKQNSDGGWGESYQACVIKQYVPHETSQLINTAWAILALLRANYHDMKPIHRGIAFLLKCQESDGDWAQQGISGVFNGNCMITYTNYRNIFPIWAIGRYLQTLQTRSHV